MTDLKTFDVKSNESIIYSMLGWKPCHNQILSYEQCKKTPFATPKDPTKCYPQARELQLCYSENAMSVEPICLPIFNDCKECLFQGDSNIFACKEQLNELVFCNRNPALYKKFLTQATPAQRRAKIYDFTKNSVKFDKTSG